MIQNNYNVQTIPTFTTCKVEYMKEEERQESERINQSSENVDSSNWICLCSENNVDRYYPDDSVMKQVQYDIIPILPKYNSILHIYTGLFMTDDGNLRYTTSLDTVSFGYEQSQVQRIEEIKKLNAIDIYFKSERTFNRATYQDAINFAYRTNQTQFQQIAQTMQKVEGVFNSVEFLKESFEEMVCMKLDEEYECFKLVCFQFLEKYVEQNPSVMFKYNIKRFCLSVQDLEHSHTGYSTSFLELIGLDTDSLIQLFHRHKRIDLVQNKLDITLQSMHSLENLDDCHASHSEVKSYITTFDGFPVQLYQRQKTIQLGFEGKVLVREHPTYFLTLTEIDIDLYDLEQLILYRQNLIRNGQNQSVDDFIQKELSFLLEDVEYSIYSQNFIDKFYNTNLQSLQKMKQQKLDEKITCKYKSILDSKHQSNINVKLQ